MQHVTDQNLHQQSNQHPQQKPDQHTESQQQKQTIDKLLVHAVGASAIASLAACGGESKTNAGKGSDLSGTNQSTVNASSTGSGEGSSASSSNSMGVAYERMLKTDADAAKFLQQAQFSSTMAEIAEVKKLGAETWLNQQIAMPVSETGWDWLISEGFNNQDNSGRRETADKAIWYQLIKSPDPLRKRVALALSEILVVSSEASRDPGKGFHAVAYWDLLNTYAFANFRQLLEAVTLSPMMGVFLGTLGNRGPNPARNIVPDENYAREVLQLFTIGLYELNLDGSVKNDASGKPLETYTQSDIMALANVFTGWVLDNRQLLTVEAPNAWRVPMVMNEVQHSTLPVSCLKRNGHAGIDISANTKGTDALKITLDALFNHPNVGPFIGKQLIQRLVTSNPSPGYIRDVASVFNNNGKGVRGDLAAVIKAILLHQEASGKGNVSTFGKVREPMLRFIQWARSFNVKPMVNGLPSSWNNIFIFNLGLSQIPLRPPSVFNFFRPGFVPANSSLSSQALVAPEFQLVDELTVPAYADFIRNCIMFGGPGNLKADYSDLMLLADAPAQLVDQLILIVNAGRFSRRDQLVQAVASIASNRSNYKLERIHFTLVAIMVSTDASSSLKCKA